MSQVATDTNDKIKEKSSKTPKVVASNRRDIPIVSFDFTNGAFAKSRKTRLISLVILGLTILVLVFVVFRAVTNLAEVSSNNSRAEQLKDAGDTIVSEYSTFSDKGTDTMALVSKYNATTSSLSTVAYGQADVEKFFTEVLRYSSPELTVASMDYNPKTDDAPYAENKASVKVRIVANGKSISAVLEFITKVTAMELLTNVTTARAGQSVQIEGDILVNNPPVSLLDKLTDLGIRYNKEGQALTTTVVADPTAP